MLVLLVAIFVRLMNYELRRDEHLYATPALLLEHYDLYADFFYNHVPGSAWLFHLVMTALGTDHLLLAGRLSVFGGWLLFGISVAWITYVLTRSQVMTLFAVLIILTNEVFLSVTGMAASNNFLPLPFAYLGLGLFLLGVSENRVRPIFVGVGGMSLAIAASIKVSSVAFILPVAIAAFFLPYNASFASRFKRVVLPLAAGGLLGAMPVLLYLITDTERFLAHVIGFHTGPHTTYWAAQTGATANVAMTLVSKGKLAYLIWATGANIVLLFTLLYFILLCAHRETLSSLLRRLMSGAVLLVLATFFTVSALSFVPTPSFPQYFAPPLVCVALLSALLYAKLGRRKQLLAQPVLVAASVILVIISLPRLTQHLGRLPDPSTWTVVQVHQAGLTIAKRLSDAQVDGKVATLAPVYPLEANLAVYPELATGQFAYRTAEFTDSDLVRHYRTTSPTSIEALFEADPPATVLVGFEPELEAPMVRFAERYGYTRVDDLALSDRYGEGVLYVRPDTMRQ